MKIHIDEKLKKILLHVDKPGRYIGYEVNAAYKPLDSVDLRLCLVYPDIYELGMSNTGLRVLYGLINQYEWAYCERTYAPWTDMREQMLAHDIPLYTMETHTPIHEIDCLGLSLQTELSYSNIPYVLPS